ncbi:MAG: hypothetical protein AVDCRST_MAG57-65, partial [uncultured Blastococcus sp.]
DGHRRDPGGAVATGDGGEPARARGGRDRGDPGIRAPLRGGRTGHDARGRGRRGLGHPAGSARGDAGGRRDRRALARQDRHGEPDDGQPHPQVPV